ncbi:MAG: glycosyltransferase family 4 protein [Actinobacteria bacterium]|nr:glycosyltransferase family 4 protein [Actinomycetota bacterium]
MRIALLADTYPPENRGGAGVVVERLARRFVELGHAVLVVATSRARATLREQDGVRVQRVRSFYPERFRSVVAMRNQLVLGGVGRALTAFRPDIVHAHNVHQHLSFASLSAAQATGAPVAYTAHDFLLFCAIKFICTGGEVDFRQRWFNCAKCQRFRWNPARNAAIRWQMEARVDHLFTISRALQTALRANGYGGAEVVYNGVDPAWWAQGDPQAFRRRHGLGDAPFALLAARVSREKGAEAAVRALARTASRHLRLVIAGDNPRYVPRLRALARELTVEHRLLFPGWITPETLRDAYAAATVTLAVSTYPDPFNLTLIESMAAGTPVIASAFGAGPEVVPDGEVGFVVNPHDTPALADRMDLVLASPARRDALRAAGLQRVRELFTLDRQVELTLARYAALRAPRG